VAGYQKVVELLQQRLRSKTQDMVGVVAQEQQLRERINDQKAFIEVGETTLGARGGGCRGVDMVCLIV
jgi:hypothetical protein